MKQQNLMITTQEIRQILLRFYDGQTTRDEEISLKQWFENNPCPDDLIPDRKVVMALSTPEEAQVPIGLQRRIANRLDKKDARKRMHLYRWLSMTGIAASVVITIGGICWWQRPEPTVYADTCETPQEAIYEVKNTLNYLSADLCQGLEAEENLGGPCP